jgi:hypothetical protein
LPEDIAMQFWDGRKWADEPTAAPSQAGGVKRHVGHVGQAVLEGTLIAVLAVGLIASATFAAKGGNSTHNGGGSSSLSLVMVNDANGDGSPNWADTVTFDPSTNATSSPQVSLKCYQGGALVFNANAAWYDGNPFAYMDYMKLKSGAWTGGAADCTAVMYYLNHRKTVTLTTLNFHTGA